LENSGFRVFLGADAMSCKTCSSMSESGRGKCELFTMPRPKWSRCMKVPKPCDNCGMGINVVFAFEIK
jgi:hypothetical protein